jgi:hypothetical protein
MPMTPDEVVKIIQNLEIDCTNPTIISQEIATHEMALDAQDPQLEGQIIRDESYERCGACPNCMFNQVKAEIITDLQDYQKLRERVSEDKLTSLIATTKLGVGHRFSDSSDYDLYLKDWRIQEKTIKLLTQSIVTYLQQPTEH